MKVCKFVPYSLTQAGLDSLDSITVGPRLTKRDPQCTECQSFPPLQTAKSKESDATLLNAYRPDVSRPWRSVRQVNRRKKRNN